MLRAKPIESVLLGVSLTLASTATTAQVYPVDPVLQQGHASRSFESSDSLAKTVSIEKQLREWEQLKKLQTSGLATSSEPSIRKTVPDTLMDNGIPQVLSLTGVGQQLGAEILHYGRVYRVDNSALKSRNSLWTVVRVTPNGVLLRPMPDWKANQLARDRSGNVFVAAPQPGDRFPLSAPYAPDPGVHRSAFPAAGVMAPVNAISSDNSAMPLTSTPAQSLATNLPPMR